jgi:hypothetical protein
MQRRVVFRQTTHRTIITTSPVTIGTELRSYFVATSQFSLASSNKVLSTTHHTPFPLRHCSPNRRRRLLSCRIRRPPPRPFTSSMPGLGATDPADLEAQARAELGFSRRLEQPRRISPYPGFGGTGGYPVWYRDQQLQRFNAGEAIDVSRRSIYRWADHLEPEDVEFSDESVSKESSDEELMIVKQSIVR